MITAFILLIILDAIKGPLLAYVLTWIAFAISFIQFCISLIKIGKGGE